MSEVASAYVSLIPSFRGGASAITKEVGPAADRAGRDAGKRFGLGFKGMLATAAGGLGGAAVVGFLKDAVGEASDLSESTSKVGVVFGKASKRIVAASKTSATAMGLSSNAYLDATGTFGNLLVSLDLGPKKAATMSKQMVKLAGDMASFNNASPQDTLDAIRSGLTGETEPLKRFGVNMNEATLKTQALKMGLIKSTKEALNPQTKALAAQALIMAQTKTAQGDFARTSGGLANQQRIAAAEVEDLKTKIGTAFLPVVTTMVKKFNADVVPAISNFVTEMQDGTGAGGELVDKLKQTVGIGRDIVGFFNSLPGPVKKFGAEGAVALVVLNKINGIFGPLGLGLRSFATNMSTAEGRMAKVTTASQALGGAIRNVAGAGGMVLLADGTTKANKAMGGLEMAAGGALSGAALGAFAGPVGAGVGAALGGLTGGTIGLYRALNQTKAEVKVSLPPWKEYTSTLSGVKAATSAATREMVYQRLEKAGLLDATRKLGLTDRQAVLAMMGDTAQRQRLASALRNQNVLTKSQKSALEKETGAVGASRKAQLEHNVAIAANREELKKARTALKNFMAEPASKRVSITGIEAAKAQLSSLRVAIEQVWGKAKAAHVAGSGGLDVLLNPAGKRASGGPVSANRTYLVGEKGPELFTTSRAGQIIPNDKLGGKGFERFGKKLVDHLLKGLKAREQALRDQISKMTDDLDALTSASADLRSSVAGNFMSDVFGGNLKSLRKGLATDTANARSFLGSLTAGIDHGLSGAFYQGLAQSGNVKLAQEVAALSPADLAILQGAFNTRNAAADAVGSKVANDFYAKPIADATASLDRIEKLLAANLARQHQIVVHDKSGHPKKTAREVARRQRFAGRR